MTLSLMLRLLRLGLGLGLWLLLLLLGPVALKMNLSNLAPVALAGPAFGC